ncbi:uncharacterized protein LOC110451341 [Mizuhopecten yessoensis]|uniref:Uncharacterized protein n=1 Tax=Mizuhopecten yessoensis TaxID=6573 RepID=A0A210QLV9_MIZYE|nr:uncharacterized protein LOC110451341 [Mizuhopecten yessoensis]XP_021354968.1 uncharacterized protein LOC110451341 [Mizuhopecten yessoensis]XP_021354969.1 uncharacterized protein LOC110451341 [Mizuhopecten yessoensis]XP_021354970.1 uncharacterized protein LOC110451341 [Mizuhopecten yessoensis]XP_021354971.1 uncharacterized protein LOC110451341 [Mizuhopecten yessoensis]OWF49723.1 hypothetical protein KP79_PYT04528 [Mizuhopecten yessoensis]
MVGQRGNRGGGRGGGAWGDDSQDMGAMGGSMLGGYGTQSDTSMYAQGGKKRSYNDSQDGYSMPNYYDSTSTDPYFRGMDPPASRFVKTESTQQPDQYASYYENWDSGYYNQGNDSQSSYSDYGSSPQQSGGGYNQSSDFSQDVDFPSNNTSGFNKGYNKNQQSWNKRGGGGGGGGGRGGRGQQQQQQQPWGRGGQGMRGGGRGNNRGNQGGGMMGKRGQQKPGFPPQKAFPGPMRGNKRGRGGRGGNAMVPPIHSLAKVSVPDVTKMSIAEKIRRFCLYLQAETNKVNSIQTIENALTGSKLGLKTEYEVEELMRVAGRWMYTGYLKLDSIFLTRSVGANKKEVKHDVYTKGLDIVKTKTVAEIFALKDPGVEAIRSELTNSLEVKKEGLGKTESLQVAKQAMEEMTNTYSTKHDGFDKLMTYLRESTNLPESQISCIEQGISASHCGLTHTFDGQMVRLPTGKLFFRGSLTIAEVVVAVGTGYKKKDAKVQTYERALEALRTKTMAQILKSVPEAEAVTGVVQEKVPTVPEKDRSSQTLLEKMTEITQLIKEAQFRENNINYLDVTAIHLGFTPTCIYRKLESEGNKTMIACELYLDSILMATGEAERRKDAQVETYNSAWDVLCTTAPDYILKEHKRLKPGDQDDPSVMDVWVKGSGKPNANTNMPGLKRNKMDPNEAWKTVDVIVLMEHEDWSFDRQRQAFCILNYSSTFNGMLLQWQTEHDGNMFKSTINLQHKMIGEASALGKNTSRNLAAACALFKLYETQHVIRISRRDDTKLWVEYPEIKTKAEALRVASGAPMEEVVATPTPADGEEKPSIPANKWVVQVAEQMITQHIAKQTLDELTFGPGMPFSESKEVRQIARNLDLKHDIRQQEGQSYLIIHKRMTPQEMIKILQANNSQSGKYSLVDKDTLPTYQNILPEIEKHEAMRNTGNTEGASKKKIKKEDISMTDLS